MSDGEEEDEEEGEEENADDEANSEEQDSEEEQQIKHRKSHDKKVLVDPPFVKTGEKCNTHNQLIHSYLLLKVKPS